MTDSPAPAPDERPASLLSTIPPPWLLAAGATLVLGGAALGLTALSTGGDEPSAGVTPPTVDANPDPSDDSTRVIPPPDQQLTVPEEQGPVLLEVGTDLQATIDRYAAGTEFLVQAGVHREQWIKPRDGDRFVGEDGAVLNGARVLEGFEAVDGRWRVGGQTQYTDPLGDRFLPGRDVVAHSEELFVDDERLTRVASLGEVGPGTWYLDYGSDTIWLGDDPTGRQVETSVQRYAFRERGVADVHIENLTIRRYANRSQRGAVDPTNSPGWTMVDVTAEQNHGPGLGIGPGTTVEGADVRDNGQIGLAGDCEFREGHPREGESLPTVVRDSRIHENGGIGFDWQWEAGGTKIKSCYAGVTFENNWVHDNVGPGIWLDVDNFDAVIRRNLAERNTVAGIFYEISFGEALIEHNVARDNGGDPAPAGLDAGIVVSNSTGVVVRENLVIDNPRGLLLRYDDRGTSGVGGERTVDDVLFEGNVVTLEDGQNGIEAWHDPARVRDVFDIRFEGNRYVMNDPGATRFLHLDTDVDFAAWQALGYDVDGEVLPADTVLVMPGGATGFVRREAYGAAS